MREQWTVGNAGWVLYQADSPLPVVLWVRAGQADDGRLEVREMYLGDDQPLSTDLLRQIPLGRIEAECNSPELRDSIVARLTLPGPDLRTAASYFGTTFGSQAGDNWITRMVAAQQGTQRRPPAQKLPELPPRTPRAPSGRLPLPQPGGKYPDSFYERFAQVYAQLARADTVAAPAVTIADANAVPVTTVHRWAKEARRRGLLAPSRKGKTV
jgi:hypothetical protein